MTDVLGLEVGAGGVRHAGERIDVVYRIFALDQVAADPRALAVLHALVGAAHAGDVGIFTSLASERPATSGAWPCSPPPMRASPSPRTSARRSPGWSRPPSWSARPAANGC
ncbi:hypothetical protein G5V59_17130 [Nocardioides sp. W3-2-3]|uniref:hypothetical protein n=1 Tax=Nocardioides convexus TaxID=2712224 RepID=UPI0024189CC7|nr:hypothetical protein [Nocardioides convexus]NHA01020.1 hypothetical protein [Nocardioides convexus]